MAFSYFYYDGADGRHYCYSKEPTFLCPMAEPLVFSPQGDLPEPPPPKITSEAIGDSILAGAKVMGMDAILLAQVIRRGHGSHRAGRRRVDGKLTNDCAICGHRMERKGFRAWIEALPDEEDVQTRVAGRLGLSNYRTVPGSSFYCDTKKEAKEWALEESKVVRASS